MKQKWMLWIGLILILVAFILVWQFAPEIQRWMANTFIKIIVVVLTFMAGWLLGRYGGKPKEKDKKAKDTPQSES